MVYFEQYKYLYFYFMMKDRIQSVVLTLAVVGIIALGVLAKTQNQQLTQIQGTLATLTASKAIIPSTEPTPLIAQIASPKIVKQIPITFNGQAWQFTHTCEGTINTSHFEGTSATDYCIGKNTLTVTDPQGIKHELASAAVAEAAHAPILIDASLVTNNTKTAATVLISYTDSADACLTTNDCGVGMPINYVAFNYALTNNASSTAMPIQNYPPDGVKVVWNASATKALVINENCGGAGCGVSPLTGYNLLTDTATPITKETAVGTGQTNFPEGNVPFNASGEKLPKWDTVQWKTDSDFIATIKNPNGTLKQVTGKF